MRYILVVMIFIVSGCAERDSNNALNDRVAGTKIDGEHLFKSNCATCHMPAKDFTGPALKAVKARWSDRQAMYDFVKNPAVSIQKNSYARELFKKWNNVIMTPFSLSDSEIDAIIDYCDNYVTPISKEPVPQ